MEAGRADTPLKIFFSGIGGSGVSAIACFMADKGHAVAGSDRAFDTNPEHPVRRLLISKNITLVSQDGNGLDSSFDFAVFSTAVEPDQPEIKRARELGVPFKTRPGFLAELVEKFRTVAVAGTSGKSTTSGMLAFLMERLGMRPNFIGGGRVKQFRTPSNPGNSLSGDSSRLVIEACESDGSLVDYRPRHSIFLNLDIDHHTVEETAGMFGALACATSETVVINADDPRLAGIPFKNPIPFSLRRESSYRPESVVYEPFGAEFSLRGQRFRLSLPGEYNLYNALACIAFLAETGSSLKDLAALLPEFSGIERRFDVHLNDGKRLVLDDYAHNPHKISSFMKAAMKVRESVCYIFQPHGYAPTRMMKAEYIEAFSSHLRPVDHLVLLPIFYAGGTVSRDISSHDLAAGIKASGKSVEVVEERSAVLERLCEREAYCVLGARDETLADFAREIAAKIASCS
ncbi:MAG: Mur ligase domain-containing protein [Thermodesulfovibrionales bacterium]